MQYVSAHQIRDTGGSVIRTAEETHNLTLDDCDCGDQRREIEFRDGIYILICDRCGSAVLKMLGRA